MLLVTVKTFPAQKGFQFHFSPRLLHRWDLPTSPAFPPTTQSFPHTSCLVVFPCCPKYPSLIPASTQSIPMAFSHFGSLKDYFLIKPLFKDLCFGGVPWFTLSKTAVVPPCFLLQVSPSWHNFLYIFVCVCTIMWRLDVLFTAIFSIFEVLSETRSQLIFMNGEDET